MIRLCTHRTQNRHFAPALVEGRENGREHPEQTTEHHEYRDGGEGFVGHADHLPQRLQRHPWQDGHQRFFTVFVHFALQRKDANLRLEAHEKGGDGSRGQIHLAHLVGTDGLPWHGRRPALPIHVDRLDPSQTNVHGAIHRGAGFFENPHHPKRFVAVFQERRLATAMDQHHPLALRIAKHLGDLGSNDRVKDVLERAARGKGQGFASTIAKMGKVILVGSHDTVASVRIAKRDGNRPRDFRVLGQVLIAFPRQVIRRTPHAEHGIQQQLQGAASRPNNEIRARQGALKAFLRTLADTVYAKQQSDADRHGKQG